MKRLLVLLLLGIIATTLSGCKKDEYFVKTLYLDSAFSITPSVRIIGTKDELAEYDSLRDEISVITNELDDIFNPNKITSVLSQINASAGVAPVQVSEEVYRVVEEALQVADETVVGGVALYDVSILPVWEKWLFQLRYYSIFDNNLETIPTAQELEPLLPLVDHNKIILDPDHQTVYLSDVGMKMDLGSIVKGYACDKIKAFLATKNITRAIIDIGGNIMTIGYNHYEGEDQEWQIKIQTPYVTMYDTNYEATKYIGTYYDSNITVVSSGVYERYIKTEEGLEYHHILDPRTGFPLDSGLLSVTIITDVSMTADAYSTAVFSLGLMDGAALVEAHEELQAVFITTNKEIYISSGLEGEFTFNERITSLGYTYKGVYHETGN